MSTTTNVTWQRLRKMVQKRDNSTCYYCGKYDEKGHCDHVLPISKGGTDSILNLVWSCRACNLKKGGKLLTESSQDYPEDKRVRPILNTIIPDLIEGIVTFLVPPYPNYRGGADYATYFEVIELMTSNPVITWLRRHIWPTSSSAIPVLRALDTLRQLKSKVSLKPKGYCLSFDQCPHCQSEIQVEPINSGPYFRWSCANGHQELGVSIYTAGFLKQMRLEAVEWAELESTAVAAPNLRELIDSERTFFFSYLISRNDLAG